MYIDYDIATITAGDYTVEFQLSPTQYQYFLDHYHQPNNPMSEISQFKLYIKEEMEKRINAFPDLGYDAPETRHLPKKIAAISFAYNNA